MLIANYLYNDHLTAFACLKNKIIISAIVCAIIDNMLIILFLRQAKQLNDYMETSNCSMSSLRSILHIRMKRKILCQVL